MNVVKIHKSELKCIIFKLNNNYFKHKIIINGFNLKKTQHEASLIKPVNKRRHVLLLYCFTMKENEVKKSENSIW